MQRRGGAVFELSRIFLWAVWDSFFDPSVQPRPRLLNKTDTPIEVFFCAEYNWPK